MYSTSIKDNRCLIRCLAVANEISANNFIVDTGAKITCCNSEFLDENIVENDVAECEVKILGGLVKGSTVKFYRYPLKQFRSCRKISDTDCAGYFFEGVCQKT